MSQVYVALSTFLLLMAFAVAACYLAVSRVVVRALADGRELAKFDGAPVRHNLADTTGGADEVGHASLFCAARAASIDSTSPNPVT